MNAMTHEHQATEAKPLASPLNNRAAGQQTVLVLQGGGALGAYQAGVYEALMEGGVEPDWVIGTSIGAINASLIAGNPPERRKERLDAFVEAMLAIYRYHVRHGVPRDVEGTGAPEPDDLRDRRKNLRQNRLPHLVATFHGEVVGYATFNANGR